MNSLEDLSNSPLPSLRSRDLQSHKGDYGRAMLLGGSQGMAGAAALAGIACLRAGAGLVTVATPRCVQEQVAGFSPAYTTLGLVDDDPGVLYWANVFDLRPIEKRFDAWAVGPGLGSPELTMELTGRMHREWTRPLVIDADGLNGLPLYDERYGKLLHPPPGPRVLTPHPGEFGKLAGDQRLAEWAKGTKEQRIEAATEYAQRDASGHTVVVLKGNRSVVTDGQRLAINPTGNPGMATAGSGDVLTGVITALVAQGLSAFDAARLGVYVHGLAGDLAADILGQASLIATDLIDYLPRAFKNLPDLTPL